MGTDKAFVVVDGCPMVVRVADALWEGGCRTIQCQGGDVAALAELGLTAFADADPGAGPVVAIKQALDRVGGPIVVAACDLADLDAATVRAVAAAGRHPAVGVAVAEADGRRHLLSYWEPATAVLLATVIDDGVRSYLAALDRVDAVGVSVSPSAVRNVNAPADLT